METNKSRVMKEFLTMIYRDTAKLIQETSHP